MGSWNYGTKLWHFVMFQKFAGGLNRYRVYQSIGSRDTIRWNGKILLYPIWFLRELFKKNKKNKCGIFHIWVWPTHPPLNVEKKIKFWPSKWSFQTIRNKNFFQPLKVEKFSHSPQGASKGGWVSNWKG